MNTAISPRVIGLSRSLLLGLLGSTIAISAQAGGVKVDEDQPDDDCELFAGLDLRDRGGDA